MKRWTFLGHGVQYTSITVHC